MMKYLLGLAAAALCATSALAQDAGNTPGTQGIAESKAFAFVGRMGTSYMDEMLIPFIADYEDIGIIGGGYQYYFYEPFPAAKLGVEVGAAARLGDRVTGEAWAGVVGRYDGFVINNRLRISPSLTFGVSAVTDTMGIEAQRELGDGHPGNVLFYLSPELSFASVDNPDTELFWRLHHRSSAWNSFGGGGSANATTIGFRQSF